MLNFVVCQFPHPYSLPDVMFISDILRSYICLEGLTLLLRMATYTSNRQHTFFYVVNFFIGEIFITLLRWVDCWDILVKCQKTVKCLPLDAARREEASFNIWSENSPALQSYKKSILIIVPYTNICMDLCIFIWEAKIRIFVENF